MTNKKEGSTGVAPSNPKEGKEFAQEPNDLGSDNVQKSKDLVGYAKTKANAIAKVIKLNDPNVELFEVIDNKEFENEGRDLSYKVTFERVNLNPSIFNENDQELKFSKFVKKPFEVGSFFEVDMKLYEIQESIFDYTDKHGILKSGFSNTIVPKGQSKSLRDQVIKKDLKNRVIGGANLLVGVPNLQALQGANGIPEEVFADPLG